VTDLAKSKEWYSRVLGWRPFTDFGEEGVEVRSARFPTAPHRTTPVREGQRRRVQHLPHGLDHLAFAVSSPDELPEWERRFADHGV
jgi:catechol 2,3-dioxygenase-like lactoylglutathione lyase family enzyme